MHGFPMTQMKPLSEIAYVPDGLVRSMGADFDELERPEPRRGRRRCRPTPWLTVGGLIAAVATLIVVVITVELNTAPPEEAEMQRAGVLTPTAAATRVEAPAVVPVATTTPAGTAIRPAVALPTPAQVPLETPTVTGAPAVINSEVITVTTQSARVLLSNVIRHALGTHTAEINVVESTEPYVEYAKTEGALTVLRMNGEITALALPATASKGLEAAADLRAALAPDRTNQDPTTANRTACVASASGQATTSGLYVRAACVDGVATPHARRPALRCYIILEDACLVPGRALLPPAMRQDAHNGPWVFSYTATSTYVRRKR